MSAAALHEMPGGAEAIGFIEEVHGPVVDIVCERLPPLHQALTATVGEEWYTFEVYRDLDERRVRAIALHRTAGLRRGLPVFDSGGPLRVPVSRSCLGRLLNVFGVPLDGGAPLDGGELRNVIARPAPLSETVPVSGILPTGIKVIDLLCPFVRGGKTLSLIHISEPTRPY